MPTVLGTLENTIAKINAHLGEDWPNPWWPNGSPAYNDCAALMSWALFGLNSDEPFYTLVSQIQYYFRGLGRMTPGADGIQRGDVIGFLWPGSDDNYSHTEMALAGVDGNGNFQTIGTNSTPDTVAVRTRNVSMVVSYARPDYPGAAIPTNQINQEEEMGKVIALRTTIDGTNDTNQMYWDGGPGIGVVWIQNPNDLSLLTRYVKTTQGSYDHFYPAEVKLLNERYLAPEKASVDPATVQSAVVAAFKQLGQTPDVAAIAAAVDASLKDDFASVPAAVNADAAKRLAQ